MCVNNFIYINLNDPKERSTLVLVSKIIEFSYKIF